MNPPAGGPDPSSPTTAPKSDKLWQGRQSGSVADITVEMGESISLDIQLFAEDIYGSVQHARMLERIGVLNATELADIRRGLAIVRQEIAEGRMPLRPELEDIHTHVESRLIELIGESARKLHTARSRNDQVALDTHLYVRRMSHAIGQALVGLCTSFLTRAKASTDYVLPGYTHLQVGQSVRLSHHLLAHFWSFIRDLERFAFAAGQANRMPLGSGAMAGVNYATDREFLRQQMSFDSIYPNSMDAVASRDHIFNYLYACSVVMVHASRMAEEIILWNSQEFAFVSLPDSLTTGSSIMPQKKNPDLAELIRGKVGRVAGHLQSLIVSVKGLPFAYNRDLQEDRFPLLDAGSQTLLCVRALGAMVDHLVFDRERMVLSLEKGFAAATDLADALVQAKGIPFREAHHIAGRLVAECARKSHVLSNVPQEIRADVHPALTDDEFYYAAVDLARSADKKVSAGGTALDRQQEQLLQASTELERWVVHAWPQPGLDLPE